MTEEENHITRLPTEQIEDPTVLRDPITQKPLSDDAKAEQGMQRQAQELLRQQEEKQQLQLEEQERLHKETLPQWLDFKLEPIPGSLKPGDFINPQQRQVAEYNVTKFDWHVDTPEVQQFLAQEKINQGNYSAINEGELDENSQQWIQSAGKEAYIKSLITRDVHVFVNDLIKNTPQANWRSPQKVFKMKEGDGKSYVVAKMAMLRALGFKDEDMVLVVGSINRDLFEEKFGEHPGFWQHVIVGVNIHSQDPAHDWILLDHLEDNIEFDAAEFLTPLYLVNNQGMWMLKK